MECRVVRVGNREVVLAEVCRIVASLDTPALSGRRQSTAAAGVESADAGHVGMNARLVPRIVGGLPGWTVQESAQPNEMVQVQMLLLPT